MGPCCITRAPCSFDSRADVPTSRGRPSLRGVFSCPQDRTVASQTRRKSEDDEPGAGHRAPTRTAVMPRRTTSRRSRRSGSRVWEELQPFQAERRRRAPGTREKRYALTMFPYPSGDLHMGHAEVFALHDVIARYWWQRGYEVLNPMGFDSFGLNAENAAIQRDEHPATFTYANIATQTESLQAVRRQLRLDPHLQHLRPGVLPLDAVAVPEVLRARPGLPQEQPGQLVPQRPDGAGQRAGHRRPLRALRRRGHQARADPVVLQDHRLRPASCWTTWTTWRRRGPSG